MVIPQAEGIPRVRGRVSGPPAEVLGMEVQAAMATHQVRVDVLMGCRNTQHGSVAAPDTGQGQVPYGFNLEET